MKFIDAARKVVETGTCHLLRMRRGFAGQYDCKPFSTGGKRGWFCLDLFTASAVVAVYDRLNDANKARMEGMRHGEAVDVALRLMARTGTRPT